MAQVTVGPRVAGTLALLVALGACGTAAHYALAERERSLVSTMPAPSVIDSVAQAGVPAATGARGTLLRLTDELGRAQIAAPQFDERMVKATLEAHWRRHLCPFAGPGGTRGRFVQCVSLNRRRELLKKVAGASADVAQRVQRDTQIFGLGEGSFDEREAIVLPPPGSVRFSVNLPKGATLRLAPAVLGEGSATFNVSCRPEGASSPLLLFSRTEQGPSKRWTERTVELSSCVGKSELVLSTETTSKETAIGLLGSPVVLAPAATALPYNVLFVIVDALRGDAVAASHTPETDAKHAAAKVPPLDAVLAKMPEITPNLNDLASQGVTWQRAWSASMWTRPATMAMLSGLRASRLGLSILELELIGNERQNFYAARHPMLPRCFRDAGADTTAIVNNMYLSGSVGVGVDHAFQALLDHRYAALDTGYITEDSLKYLESHRDERFFLLVNYASPHSPHSPPPADLAAIRGANGLPAHPTVRGYLGEIHKDDRAIGQLLAKLDALGLREETLVVVTADHGETMSAAHDVSPVDVAQGVHSGRFTHLSTMWAEAANVAMVMSLPQKLPAGLLSQTPVQTTDLMPTILELEGLPVPAGLDGRSLVPLFSGKSIEDRPIVIEGRGARSIQLGDHRLIVRDRIAQRLRRGKNEFEKKVELYDHAADPGERVDIASAHPELVSKLRAQLDAERPLAGGTLATSSTTRLHLKVALGGKSGHVELRLFPRGEGELKVTSSELDVRAMRQLGKEVRVAFDATRDSLTGLDLELSGQAELGWEVSLDGKPWPAERIFGGALGLRLEGAESGLRANLAPRAVESATMPHIAAGGEMGLFVIREPKTGVPELEVSAAAQLEAEQAMQAWGYAKKTPKRKP